MLKTLAIVAAMIAAAALPAAASQPPVIFIASPDKIAELCAELGPRVSLTAWHFEDDQYGCADTATGSVIVCEKDQTCTLYFGPRPAVSREA